MKRAENTRFCTEIPKVHLWYDILSKIESREPHRSRTYGVFLMSEGGGSDAKETEEAVFLPRMPEADRGTVL